MKEGGCNMFDITYSLNLSATSMIDDMPIVHMNASINPDHNIDIIKNITDQDSYEKNRTEVLKDMTDFDAAVYAEFDRLKKEYK